MAKKRRPTNSKNTQTSEANLIKERARKLPIDQCYATTADLKEEKIGHIIIIRKHTNGNITFAVLFMDLALYGIKNCLYGFNRSPLEIENILEKHPLELSEVSYEQAHNYVYAGLEWADEYGFLPAKEWNVVKYVLEEDNEDVPLIEVECGIEGKPAIFKHTAQHFLADVKTLEETAGAGNFLIYADMHENDEDDPFNYSEAFDNIIDQITQEDFDAYVDEEELSQNSLNFTDESSFEIFIPVVNRMYYEKIGFDTDLPEDLIDYTIGEKDIALEIDSSREEKELVANLQKSIQTVQVSDIYKGLRKFPRSSDLYEMLFNLACVIPSDEGHELSSLAKKVYDQLPNEFTLGNYLVCLVIDDKPDEFKELLASTDFYNKVLRFEGDIPQILFLFYCLSKTAEYIQEGNIEEADNYYFASRIFYEFIDNLYLLMISTSLINLKAGKLGFFEDDNDINADLRVAYKKDK
jgi:hypothetical protein